MSHATHYNKDCKKICLDTITIKRGKKIFVWPIIWLVVIHDSNEGITFTDEEISSILWIERTGRDIPRIEANHTIQQIFAKGEGKKTRSQIMCSTRSNQILPKVKKLIMEIIGSEIWKI